MTPELVLEDERWMSVALQKQLDRTAEVVAGYFSLGAGYEFDVLACDDARIATLNSDFRAKDQATNVLSWPSEERGAETPGGTPLSPTQNELGDIAIAYETCLREAEEQGKSPADHITHLLIHALLHLLGYDHIDDKDAALMERIEVELLGKLGIADPY